MVSQDPRFDILFEPVQIGPVTSKNRFYQVPHCNGTGDSSPRILAGMREVKAEGGWGVVCTENLMVDPSSDIAPFQAVRLWSDEDVPSQELMVEAVHKHGALAGCELTHFGIAASNRNTRAVPMGPSSRMTMESIDPRQSRRMDKTDIKNFRLRHRQAAIRAKQAGFDVIYVYCTLENSILAQFFSKKINDRTDEYGGSFENRTRLFRELLQDTLEAVGDRCGVAVRMPVAQFSENQIVETSELKDIISSQANVPDLWDVNINSWSHDSATSRFGKEGHQEDYMGFVKSITTKPVVGVGRFTSPETMLSQVKRGIVDFIGAARPSIADPFLPQKIQQGRVDEIRECIGCNICVSGENSFSIMRCTQNPTIMEEWRRGWHPERVEQSDSNETVLIIGAGPAGLESGLTLARRGYDVMIAETTKNLGGRVLKESKLPGLSEWIRVRDYRVTQLQKLSEVEIYLDSLMTVEDVEAVGADHVICATGSTWRRDGLGRQRIAPFLDPQDDNIYTPDDVMNNVKIKGPVVIYDDDGGYLSSAVAEKLTGLGCSVQIVTPHATFSRWTKLTLEQSRLIERMSELGITLHTSAQLTEFQNEVVKIKNMVTENKNQITAASLVVITSRIANDQLYLQLKDQIKKSGKKFEIHRIGDCNAPGLIADAIFAGHYLGRNLGAQNNGDELIRREFFI